MTIDRDLYVAFRTVFAATVSRTWANDDFIPANDSDGGDGIKPDPPYLTGLTVNSDISVGIDERQPSADISGNPTEIQVGQRTSLLSVNAFGFQAADWLAEFNSKIQLPAVEARMTTQGITVRRLGGLRNLSTRLDTGIEHRYQQDYEIDYRVVSDTETQVELLHVQQNLEHDPATPDAWPYQVTVDL